MHLLDCDSSPIQSPLHPSGAVRELDCSIAHIRLRGPGKSKDKIDLPAVVALRSPTRGRLRPRPSVSPRGETIEVTDVPGNLIAAGCSPCFVASSTQAEGVAILKRLQQAQMLGL
ncbi:hypothetical protein GW17_00014324 [Ensete ventricosum]|nr:hypothetical protein GW17_00014324 [Ensete ventricosum]